MEKEDIDGMSHWSFTQLYEQHKELYILIYRKAVDSIRVLPNPNPSSNVEPSIASLEKAVQGLLTDELSFTEYCDVKLSVNIEWRLECLEAFSEYIVHMLHTSIK